MLSEPILVVARIVQASALFAAELRVATILR